MEKEASSVNVVLADPQAVARIGTREVLEGAGVSVAGETGSGEEALHLAQKLAPDVLVCEMDLPDLSGLQIAVRLSEEDAPVQVLALTAYEDKRYVRHLMENGIAGYLKKSETPARIVQAVRGVACGEEGWLSPEIAQKAMNLKKKTDGAAQLEACSVTPTERKVLRQMVKGFSNQEIADALFISKQGVQNPRLSDEVLSAFSFVKARFCAETELSTWVDERHQRFHFEQEYGFTDSGLKL